MKTFYKILFAMIFLFPVIIADGQNQTGYHDKSSPQTLHNSKYQLELSVMEIPDELSKSKGENTLPRDAKARYTGWENDPDSLDVYIDDSWTEEEKDSVRAGIARWNAAGCEPALRESSTSSGAEITIAKSSKLADNEAGKCITTYDPDTGKNIGCEIQINDDTSPLSIKEVVTHELGHALGLKDTDADDNASDVMRGTGESNGSDGNLSQNDSTELRQAISQITTSGEEPTEQKNAVLPEQALMPGEAGMLMLPLDMIPSPGTEVVAMPLEDPLLFVEFAYIEADMLFVELFIDPAHGSGHLLLDIFVFPPDGEPFNFIGKHYINQNPVSRIDFQCPFAAYQIGEFVKVNWMDFHTYPFGGALRSQLVVDGNTSYEVRPDGDYSIQLSPGMHLLELYVDDFQVNSAYFAANIEVQDFSVPWEDGFEDYSPGSDIVGQGGWEFWFGGESSPSARVTEEQVHTGEKALKILGNPDMTGDDIVHQFTGCTSGVWEVNLWQYILPAATTGSTYITLLNQYGYTLEDCNWSTQLMFNAADGIVESQFEGAQLPLVKGEWVPIEIVLDFDNDLQTISYNGELLTSKSWTEGIPPAGNMELAVLNLFSGDMTQFVYYDDISISTDDNFGLEDIDVFQISYDWGEWSEENSRAGLLSCTYTPAEEDLYLNAFTLDTEGEIFWLGQNYLPDASHSSVMQKTTFNYDLAPLGIESGNVLEAMPLWLYMSDSPVSDLTQIDFPNPDIWPTLMVSPMVDDTYHGLGVETTLPGFTYEWPVTYNPGWWNGIIEELEYRGCNVPELDLDYTNHPAVPGGYAGDSNACIPAAVSSSLEWLEDVYEDSVPTCDNNQTHRQVLEELSNEMNRPPNSPPATWTDYIGGKLKYTQNHRLPIRTKFQMIQANIPVGTDVRPEGSNYSAENQTGASGKPDWNWIVDEMNDGEDVEIHVNFWNGTKWNGGHAVVCTGVAQLTNGTRLISFKHDRTQRTTDANGVLQEPSIVTEGNGWLIVPALSGPAGTAIVTNVLSESYDKTVDYKKASGTLQDSDGNPVDPTKVKIKARRWDNPDDSLSTGSGTVKYEIIDGKGFWDIEYDDFETPPQPGDRIVVTFWDGEKWVTKVFRVPEDGGPIYEDVTVEDLMQVHLDFTEWIQITIPPHKTLKVHWDSVTGCGNTDIVQWNGEDWYVPPYGHWNFNPTCTVKEISNDTDSPQYKRFHCDDPDGFYLDFSLVESTGVTTGSNQSEYATVNLGGMDSSNEEFGDITEMQYEFNYQTNAQLGEFPGTIGEEGVQELTVTFESFDNIYWEDMMLTLDIADVWQDGFLEVALDGNPDKALVPILPGVPTVTVNIGPVLPVGIHTITLTANLNVIFDVDCFNITTLVPIPTENYDYGDCPDDPYPTLLANDGARHMVDNLTYLGALIDAEADGQPNASATGDDISNLADEDGITFGPIMPGSPAQITIDPKINPDPDLVGFLQGWMDFNRDGDWDDQGEQIFLDEVLHFSSPKCLLYNVPASVTAGSVYARFRFSTVPGLDYFGTAPDGEVEDYQVEITQNQGYKWMQEPCPELSGLHCHDYVSEGEYNYTTIADDWQCNGGVVTDIHWWGNYEDVGFGINYFHLSIHENDPATCMPMQQEIWGMDVPFDMANETLWSGQIFSYEYVLDEPFEQEEGKTYWLDITAFSVDQNVPAVWRWQESDRSTVPYNILCPAAKTTMLNPQWSSIVWISLQPVRYSQMAFAITSVADVDIDFGDAPDEPYPTLLASDGARHIIDGVTFLGDQIDTEPDGQPNNSASGDDAANLDDEDGVVFRGPLVAGSPTILKVKASVDGKLNVWLDVDRNGSWAEGVDHVFVDYTLVAGWNTLTLNVPANAKTGMSYMRFRFSEEGGETYYGLSTYGEVEDYRVRIFPEGWSFIQTPVTHTILVPINVILTNTSLSAQDAIGVWYEDDDGNLVCGGADIWDGTSDRVVLAYGNDNTTPEKDGFDDGEVLTWTIHHTGTGIDEFVTAEYDASMPQSDGNFTSYGISKLTELIGLNVTATADPTSVCAGDMVQLDVIVSGGSGNYTYSWTSNPPGFTSNDKDPVDFPTQDISYIVQVDDGISSVSSSVDVSVQPGPTADAGDDVTICETDSYQLDATATNYSTLAWTSNGDGTFSNSGVEDPVYFPGPDDIANGSVTLSLSALPVVPCSDQAVSSMVITFEYLPVVDAGDDDSVCAGGSYQLQGTVTGSNSYMWSTSGDGSFDDKTALDAVYTPGPMDAANGMVILTLTGDPIPPCLTQVQSSIVLTVFETQTVALFKGWNGLSSYLSPFNQNSNIDMFDPVIDSLIIVYNQDGQFWPSQSIDNLVWDEESGYVIKLDGDGEMIFCGDDVSDMTVSVDSGLNIVPVLSNFNADITSVFDAGVDLKLVLEVAGWKVFWPDYNINTILNLEVGKSYFVFMNSDDVIDFNNASTKSGATVKPVDFAEAPWNEVLQTPGGHMVAFAEIACKGFAAGDVIGAFTGSGLCAGITGFEGVATGIVLKGDDPYTWQTDGFIYDETVSFKLFRPSSGESFDLQVTYDPGLDHSGRYHHFSMSAISSVKLTPTGIYGPAGSDIRIYPNPSHGIFNVVGISGQTGITVFDAFGNEIFNAVVNEKTRINLSMQPRGVYLVKIKTLNGTHYQKVVIN